MDLCPRCLGGEIHAPNCFKCGGSGWVNETDDTLVSRPPPVPAVYTKRPKANKSKKKRKQKSANTPQLSITPSHTASSPFITPPDSASIAKSRTRRVQEAREKREAEKARRVKTFKVRLSPEEQRRKHLEELERQTAEQRRKEEQARLREMEERKRACGRSDSIQITRDGAIAGPLPKQRKHRKPGKTSTGRAARALRL